MGQGLELNVNQIAYCLAEKVRLGAARTQLDGAAENQIVAFNAAVEDFNGRCGYYRYAPSEMSRAEDYVAAHRELLTGSGIAKFAAEPPRAAAPVEAMATPPEPPTAPTETESTGSAAAGPES